MIEVGSLLGSGWASGLNLYLVVAMFGIAGRMEVVNAPRPVQNYLVIAAAGAMYAVEFVIDKIPVLDSLWDVAHTVIRPVGAAALAYSFAAHDVGSRSPIASAAIAAALALTAHGAKATTRIVINASPEPFTNIAASLTEDGLAGGMVLLAIRHPRLALLLAVMATVMSIAIVVVLLRTALRILGGITGKRRSNS